MEHQYQINIWQSGRNQETACLIRTTHIEDFLLAIESLKNKNKISNRNAEIIVTKTHTFLSCSTEFDLKYWRPRMYFYKPLHRFKPFDSNGALKKQDIVIASTF